MSAEELLESGAAVFQGIQRLPRRHYVLRRKIADALHGVILECEFDPQSETKQLPSLERDPARRHTVVLKCISLERAANAAAVSPARFVDNPWDEWKTANKIIASGGHRHVLHIVDRFICKEAMFLVSEYCQDGDLHEFIQSTPTRSLPESEAIPIFRQIAEGLGFLHHTLDVAHRDLSLDNILLQDGVCKISDFGLSTCGSQLTNGCAGKDYYMAPEVVSGSDCYDPKRVDVWSLGIILFILLTGSPLFPVASGVQLMLFKAHGVDAVLRKWGCRDQLSDSIVNLLTRMLEINPNDRIEVLDILAHPSMV